MKLELPKSFDDLTLGTYLETLEVAKNIKGDGSLSDELETFKLLSVLTGATEEEIDRLEISEMKELMERMTPLINEINTFDGEGSRVIEIDGVTYVAKDYNHLDNGEYISLNLLQERFGNNNVEAIPMMLAILVRPGTKKYDFEKSSEYWDVEPLNRRDTENLEFRADLFRNKAKAKDLLPIATFFLNGKGELEKPIQTSIQEK